MKVIAIGDIHGRSVWKEIIKRKREKDIVVFIGDYFDSFNIIGSKQLQNFLEILEFKRKNLDTVFLLIGNHDFHYSKYAGGEKCSGFQDAPSGIYKEIVDEAIKDELLQVAYSYQDILFTHAGVSKTWAKNSKIKARWAEGLAQELNNALYKKAEIFRFNMGVNLSGYGDDVTQGPVWIRPTSLLSDKPEGVRQVVGHTHQNELRIEDGVAFIDVFDKSSSDFLAVQEDGTMEPSNLTIPERAPKRVYKNKHKNKKEFLPQPSKRMMPELTYQEILPYLRKKLVSEQIHPEDPNVRIYNYTQECQFSKAWDEITTQCRGLILNVATGETLARPFEKFFNYQEHIEKNEPLPDEKFNVYKKMDGSLGILYWLNNKPWIATRGSFVSDQAKWATAWWRKNMGEKKIWTDGVTHLFEIIYPENRIVVAYDFSGLVHLGTVDIKSGKSYSGYERFSNIQMAEKINASDIATIMEMNTPNEEGFVLHYPGTDLRLKIKFPEYVRLHKIVTGVSEIGIWEHMKDGKNMKDLIENVPDEFMKWVKDVYKKLHKRFDEIEKKVKQEFSTINLASDGLDWKRKDWAREIQYMTNPSIGFAMLDKKDYDHIIWKMIRPVGQSQFKKDIDS